MAKKPNDEDSELTEVISVRATREDVAMWKRAAKKDGRPRANWARRRLNAAARAELGLPPDHET